MGYPSGDRPPYDTVANLLAFATANKHELDGILLMRGVDLAELPIRRALNVLWAIALEGRDSKERSKTIAQLTRPSPQRMMEKRDDFWAGHEEDAAAFRMAARGVGGDLGDAFG